MLANADTPPLANSFITAQIAEPAPRLSALSPRTRRAAAAARRRRRRLQARKMPVFEPLDLGLLLATTLAATLLHVRLNLAARLLVGLKAYAPAGGAAGTASAGGAVKRSAGNGGANDTATAADREAEEMPLLVFPLSVHRVTAAPQFAAFDSLLFVAALPPAALALFAAARAALGAGAAAAPRVAPPAALAAAAAALALSALVRVDLASPYTAPRDRAYAGLVAAGGLAAACALFAAGEAPGTFGWDPDAAAAALRALLEGAAARGGAAAAAGAAALGELPSPPPAALRALLALLAAALGALLFAPALRFARAHRLHAAPPAWAAEQLAPGAFAALRLHAHLLAPALCALTWTRPLFGAALGLAPRAEAGAQAAAAALTGALMLANVRVLSQRYLDSTLLSWHALKHAPRRGGSRAAERAAAARVVAAKSDAVMLLLGKAAVQSAAPGALFLALGCGLGWAAVAGGGPGQAGAAELVRCFFGFAVWWAGAAWFLSASLVLWMFRSGALQS